MKLSEILVKYIWLGEGQPGTDKNRLNKGHNYGLVYDALFDPFRDKEIDLIEIGIRHGASLMAWREFFPNAHISGVDIVDLVENKDPTMEYIITDVKKMKPTKRYDIVIDDGSHKIKDILYTIKNFKLKVGGIMIIEDLRAPNHWMDMIREATNYSVEIIDLRGATKKKDNFLVVLRNYGYEEI